MNETKLDNKFLENLTRVAEHFSVGGAIMSNWCLLNEIVLKMNFKIKLFVSLIMLSGVSLGLRGQETYKSAVWSADLGDGRYQNPILYADYSDPDVCRVGDDFYMTASSFNAVPGLPILHSKDMVNWRLINHAIDELTAEEGMPDNFFDKPQHGNGVWAPAIRYHKGEFFIYYGDPDFGIYMTKTKDPAGVWEPLKLVKAGKGLIDACPFWDENGKAYLVHAYAGSRAGIKSLIAVTRLSDDGSRTVGRSKIVYDGHDADPTIEGPKFYKRGEYYYIFAPAGGVATGWQTVLRAKDIFGPYERKVVLSQGKTAINGPHQGAWVDSGKGEDWFFHFQDVGPVGRIVHLQPMVWKDDWPVIGEDEEGDGIGSPVLTYRKPIKGFQVNNPQESDEFNENFLGLQWQWHGNPEDWWFYTDKNSGVLSLYSVPTCSEQGNLWDASNLLLQKMPASAFMATTKVTFKSDQRLKNERTGLLVMGMDYAGITIVSAEEGLSLHQIECYKADKAAKELVNEKVPLQDSTVYLRVNVKQGNNWNFSYSLDGKNYKSLGKTFTAREGKWIGTKLGIFCSRLSKLNDGGRADYDWFRIE